MAKGNITGRSLKALRGDAERSKKECFLWDTTLDGLGAKASPTGRVSWVVQKWMGGKWKEGGKAKRIVIGHNPPMTVEKARIEAGAITIDVAKHIDVVQRKREQRRALNQEMNGATLLQTFERYHKRNHKDGVYWQQVDRSFRSEIADKLGKDALVAKVTKADIRKLIDAKLDAGLDGAARNLFAILRPFFTWCVQQDAIAVSPMDTLANPSPAKSRDRSLTKDEIKSVWQASSSLGYPFGTFYRLCLLTGQRREEVAGMRWSEIADKVWTIPGKRTKNGKEHIVHLSSQAVAVLATVEKVKGVPFVFSTTGDSSISGFTEAKARLDKAMGIVIDPEAEAYDPAKLWWVHDMRRTIVSTLAELGFPTDVADRLLNHVSGSSKDGVKGVYQRYEFVAERKRAIEAWGNYVESLVANRPVAGNVVSLKARI